MESPEDSSKTKAWVKFDDEGPEPGPGDKSTAIIKAESTQINIDKSKIEGDKKAAAVITPESVHINVNRPSRSVPDANRVPDSRNALKNVDLRDAVNGRPSSVTNSGISNAVIRQGFANGDIIVTLLPVNTKWPWITPAQFRPELVPEELMAQGLTLTVEDYVHVMELLTNDVRFNLYNICYKRILVLWIFTAFVVLLGLLFSGITGLTLFGLGVMWLVLNAAAIFLCMWIKIKLNHNLEKCLGQVNKQLLKHKIILGLDDRGKISCHKVNLCFIYFDTTDCIKKLQEVIEREEREGRPINREETPEERHNRIQFQQRMDIDDSDIVIQGVNTTRLPRKQERAEMLYLRYSSRWVRQFLRNLLELSVDGSDPGSYPRVPPRHCVSARCPCQFIEEHLKYKPRGDRPEKARPGKPEPLRRCTHLQIGPVLAHQNPWLNGVYLVFYGGQVQITNQILLFTPADVTGEEYQEFVCGFCRREVKDPRLLPCLHSFCLECLRVLEEDLVHKPNPARCSSSNQCRGTSKKKWTDMVVCGGKGHEMFGISNSAYEGDEKKRKILECPTCGFTSALTEKGVVELPRNYLLQHRLLIAKLNASGVQLLCDLCQQEIVAISRCVNCLVNLCGACSTAHHAQHISPEHEMVSLSGGDSTITKIRRQAMCPAHPQYDIRFFCQSCNQMTCKMCCVIQHRDHSCGLLSKAARIYRRKIKEVLDQTVYVVREAESSKANSESVFHELLSNCVTVKKDIDTYINSYIEALEEHRKGLKLQVEQARRVELQNLKEQLMEAERRRKEGKHAVKFGEELLAEASDFEVISLASPLLRRLEWIIQSGAIKTRIKTKSAKLMQFLRDERAGTIKTHPVFGVLTNQIVSPAHSSLTPEALIALRNCTQKQQCQVKLVTRDSSYKPVNHGAENVDMDLRYADDQRQVPVLALDQQDGTYLITFTPDSPGNLRLSITIRGHAIRGSPFMVHVRKPLVHKGVFHCCTFCSSGGSKKALCGCGGRMPGGYLGCGHGHVGHPGKRHWSCCGNTFPNSECIRKPTGFYQLTF